MQKKKRNRLSKQHLDGSVKIECIRDECLLFQAGTLLLELVYPTTHSIMPPTADLKRAPKLIWLDSGLVNYASEIQREYLLNTDLIDTWRGMAAEQIVAQELKALTNEVGKKRNFLDSCKAGQFRRSGLCLYIRW